jgi:hypothetical protein
VPRLNFPCRQSLDPNPEACTIEAASLEDAVAECDALIFCQGFVWVPSNPENRAAEGIAELKGGFQPVDAGPLRLREGVTLYWGIKALRNPAQVGTG